jgi:hypothetical protein
LIIHVNPGNPWFQSSFVGEHLQAGILEMIETLGNLQASAEREIFRELEQDEQVIDRIAAARRVIAGLVVFQQPEMELDQRRMEASRNRLAELERYRKKAEVLTCD